MTANGFERISRAASRRPALTLAIVLALALAGGALALGLRPSAGIDTFVGASSPAYRATADQQRHFGDEPVIVLVHEPLPDLVQTSDLATVTQLEACLAGQYVVADARLRAFTPAAPGHHAPYGGWHSPCGMLARAHATKVVYGPGTFLNRAVAAVNSELSSMLTGERKAAGAAESSASRLARARGMSVSRAKGAATAAARLESAQQLQTLERLALNSGLSGLPSIDNAQFIGQVVFDATRGPYQPKARFAYLFPNKDSALIQVRLRAGLTDVQRARAIAWIRQAVRMPMFTLAHGGTYTVTGVPVVINDLAATITGSIAALLIAALAVMAIALLVVFRAGGRAPARLLPLALALAATGITFGLLAVAGAGLTLASIAVLPVLIGLAVDYGVQFQARVREERGGSVREERGGSGRAVGAAAGRAAPAIGAAAAATGTGFLVLLLSPVPMVRGFGVLLVVGIAVAFAVALTAGSAALAIPRGGRSEVPPPRRARGPGGRGPLGA
ncbi:MAG: MMPL family transporter, partial [Solirubrobacteraceae bacterium]